MGGEGAGKEEKGEGAKGLKLGVGAQRKNGAVNGENPGPRQHGRSWHGGWKIYRQRYIWLFRCGRRAATVAVGWGGGASIASSFNRGQQHCCAGYSLNLACNPLAPSWQPAVAPLAPPGSTRGARAPLAPPQQPQRRARRPTRTSWRQLAPPQSWQWSLAPALAPSLMAACAAARRAMGTRRGEQET